MFCEYSLEFKFKDKEKLENERKIELPISDLSYREASTASKSFCFQWVADNLSRRDFLTLSFLQEKIGKTQTDTGGSKDNEAIITELQTLHAQLLATNKIGLLLVHQHGECVLPTIGKILDLQMHFDNTCSEAHSKHCHIDKSQLQLKLFRVCPWDHLIGILFLDSWRR